MGVAASAWSKRLLSEIFFLTDIDYILIGGSQHPKVRLKKMHCSTLSQ